MKHSPDGTKLVAHAAANGRKVPDFGAPVFLLYSHDGFGIGHVQRNLAIARAITRIAPGSNVVLVAGVVPPTSCLSDGIDIIKVPSIRKTAPGQWQSDRLSVGTARIKRMRQRIIRETIASLDPDVVLVDYLPVGASGELTPVIEVLHRRKHRPMFALGLRDVLDSRESVFSQWEESGSYDAIDSYYDRILVYGDEDVFATARHYQLADRAGCDIRYCGYVSNAEPARSRDEIRRTLGLEPSQKLVAVTGGGGRDAFQTLRCAMDAIHTLSAQHSLRGLLLAGPFVDTKKFDALRDRAQESNVSIVPYTVDAVGFVAAADVVVSMGGYNTLCEALRHRKKILVVPRSGPSMEQRMRAGLFARRERAAGQLLDLASRRAGLEAPVEPVADVERLLPHSRTASALPGPA
jgi:predicted glycosyltransferase